MAVNNIIEKLKVPRKQREIDHWTKKYDIALKNFEKASIGNRGRIEEIRANIQIFKEKYPFYTALVDLIETETNKDSLRSRIVEEIISYLEIAYQKGGEFYVKKGNYLYKSKKVYSTEIKLIRKDLNAMLYYAFIINDSKQKAASENDFNAEKELIKTPKITYKKPGRKSYSELAVIALKYHIINKFNKKENPHSDYSRFARVQDFYEYVALKEGLKVGSFSNKYKEIGREKDIERYCRSNPNVVEALIDLNCFFDNDDCYDFLSQFDASMK